MNLRTAGRRRVLALPSLAMTLALALAVGACSDTTGEPTAGLSLASMSGLAADSGTESNASAISGLSGSAAALATPLPEGPTNGPIYVPAPTVDATRVAGLATTLGITQPPTEQPGGWSAEMANADPAQVQRLIVFKDQVGSWLFGTGTDCDLSTPTSNDSTCSSSATADAPPPTRGASADPATCAAPALEQVRPKAQTVLDAGGASGPVRTDTADDGCAATFTSTPSVAGLPVSGLDASVTFVLDGNVPAPTSGFGTFAAWTPEGDYPLVDAEQGWERVAMRPMPAMAELCQVPPDGTGCLTTTETMSSVEFGLMRDLDLATDRIVLVPAWLFTVTSTLIDPDGGPAPPVDATTTSVIAVTAIADSALVQPPGEVSTATSEPGGSGDSEPGSPGSSGSSDGSDGVSTAIPPDTGPADLNVPERMADMDAPAPTPLD